MEKRTIPYSIVLVFNDLFFIFLCFHFNLKKWMKTIIMCSLKTIFYFIYFVKINFESNCYNDFMNFT